MERRTHRSLLIILETYNFRNLIVYGCRRPFSHTAAHTSLMTLIDSWNLLPLTELGDSVDTEYVIRMEDILQIGDMTQVEKVKQEDVKRDPEPQEIGGDSKPYFRGPK